MVASEHEIRSGNLFSLANETLGDAGPTVIPLLAQFQPAPEKTFVCLHYGVCFLLNPHPSPQTIIDELRAIWPKVYRHQAISRIPLIRIGRSSSMKIGRAHV